MVEHWGSVYSIANIPFGSPDEFARRESNTSCRYSKNCSKNWWLHNGSSIKEPKIEWFEELEDREKSLVYRFSEEVQHQMAESAYLHCAFLHYDNTCSKQLGFDSFKGVALEYVLKPTSVITYKGPCPTSRRESVVLLRRDLDHGESCISKKPKSDSYFETAVTPSDNNILEVSNIRMRLRNLKDGKAFTSKNVRINGYL